MKKSLLAAVILLGAAMAFGQTNESRDRSGNRSHRNDEASRNERRARRQAMVEGFLKRMDANGNGKIDADEVSAEQKPFAEGMLRRMGLEAKYPINISDVKQALEKSSQGSRGEGPQGGTPDGRGGPGGRDGGPPPGGMFGGPPGGFSGGPPGGMFGGPPDGNNGNRPPWMSRSPRPGAEDADRTADDSPNGANPSRERPPRFDAASGPPNDRNRRARSRQPKDAESTANTSAAQTAKTDGADADNSVMKSGRFLSPKERLTDLPQWFLEKDVDNDGQVAMAEYADTWTNEVVRDFNRFDLNRDGFITPAECLKAMKFAQHDMH